jgi:hypothetical protein
MIDIFISPAEGCGGFVILLDVTDELSGQVGRGSEDPPSNDIALNFGKPDFDLTKPARIGRRVMDPNAWIGVKKLQDIGFYVRSSCRPRCEFLCPQAGWPRSGPKSRQTRRWYAERWSCR